MASATITSPAMPHESYRPLSEQELGKMHAYWRAANCLSVGQIYLLVNPLLKEALKLEHVKPRLLGHSASRDPGITPLQVNFRTATGFDVSACSSIPDRAEH